MVFAKIVGCVARTGACNAKGHRRTSSPVPVGTREASKQPNPNALREAGEANAEAEAEICSEVSTPSAFSKDWSDGADSTRSTYTVDRGGAQCRDQTRAGADQEILFEAPEEWAREAWDFLDGAAPEAVVAQRCEIEEPDAEKVAQILELLQPGQPLSELSGFAKEAGNAEFCGRLLRKYGGNVRKCREKFKQSLLWREEMSELLIKRNFVHAGDLRVIGRDREMHPLLYQCMKNQTLPGPQGLDQMVVRFVEAIELLPPGVQGTVHMWDLHGLKLHLNLNPAPLVHMVQGAEGYFAERMHTLIIVDLPRTITFIKDAIWPLVPERTRAKIHFFSAEEAKEHLRRACTEEVACRVISAMDVNRDASLGIEDRRRSWVQVDGENKLVSVF